MRIANLGEILFLPTMLITGIILGFATTVPEWITHSRLSSILLALLVFQVGLGLGSRRDFTTILRTINFKTLLLPGFTIAGTIAFTSLGYLLITQMELKDCLAVGSGFGYYSLSSMLILQLKTPCIGMEAATLMASTALLTNIIRELAALLFCTYVSKSGRGIAAITLSGINSMDVCLPSILADTNHKNLMPMAIIHGIALELSVPLLMSLFC